MRIHHAFVAIGGVFLLSNSSMAQAAAIGDAWRADEYRQFDFWIGKWDVNLRMLQPDNTWKDSVKAKVEIYSILDGRAILELWDSPSIKGFSLRYYDPAKKKWVLHLNWPSSSQSSLGSLEGEFRHGRGEFYSGPALGVRDASVVGRTSRYTFCDISPDSLRWDDAYSDDGGKTWTHNWIMEFSRTAATANWPQDSLGHTFASGGRCVGEPFDALNSMAGNWSGEVAVHTRDGEKQMQAKMRVYNVLDGCSVLRFLSLDTGSEIYRSFGLLTYNASSGNFEELSLDNNPASGARTYRGELDDEQLTLLARAERAGQSTLFRHVWSLPSDEDQILLKSASSLDGEEWAPSVWITLSRDEEQQGSAPDAVAGDLVASAINSTCPRSGKPIVAGSLAEYRGQVVGFCNTHCRDDFVANPGERPNDEAFFDKLIDGE